MGFVTIGSISPHTEEVEIEGVRCKKVTTTQYFCGATEITNFRGKWVFESQVGVGVAGQKFVILRCFRCVEKPYCSCEQATRFFPKKAQYLLMKEVEAVVEKRWE